jgi:Holliday junction resolvasome RuvABC ATP-dependent DNA helicase subunit
MGEGDLSAVGQAVVGSLDFSFPGCRNVSEPEEERMPLTPEAPPEVAAAGANKDAVAGPDSPGQDVPGAGRDEADTTEGATLSPVISPVPPALRRQVKEAFLGFIGNDPAVRRLANDLLRALIEKPPHLSKNYLLTGQPSTGKTELARRIAVALGLPFVRLDGRGVASRDRVFELVKGDLAQKGLSASQVGHEMGLPVLEYPALIVFIDEVHLVPKAVQESLLTMLEAADRTVTLASEVARMTKATFVFATTRPTDVDAAFRTRCTEIQLEEYDLSEVAEIVRSKVGRDWSRETFLEIARLGRRVPRVALEIARELDTEITVSEHPGRTVEEHLEEVRKTRQIDSLGLMRLDAQYLELLEREGRPLGETAVLNMLGQVDRARVTEEIEPFLRRLGFIKHGPRGREITPEGRAYLLARRRGQTQ